MTNTCTQCGKDKVADYPECGLIVDDLATTDDIKNNNGWKMLLDAAFQTTQKIRCEFMHWMIERNLATPDPDPLNEGLYILPEKIELHPSAMIDLEQSLIQLARDNNYNREVEPPIEIKRQFYETLENYKTRVAMFFEGQHQLLALSAE